LETNIVGRKDSQKIRQKNKIWHPLRGIALWIIWIERNDKVFNHEQWHESKVKHWIWDDLIVYVKAAWNRVIEQIKISSFSAAAMLQGFDKTWGARNVGDTLFTYWVELEKATNLGSIALSWGLSLASGVGVVLGLVGPVGCPWWGLVVVTLYVAVFHLWGTHLPLEWARFLWFLFILALVVLAFYLKKKQIPLYVGKCEY
jgi:hypothetical protein